MLMNVKECIRNTMVIYGQVSSDSVLDHLELLWVAPDPKEGACLLGEKDTDLVDDESTLVTWLTFLNHLVQRWSRSNPHRC